jgi:hypothetical protein
LFHEKGPTNTFFQFTLDHHVIKITNAVDVGCQMKFLVVVETAQGDELSHFLLILILLV